MLTVPFYSALDWRPIQVMPPTWTLWAVEIRFRFTVALTLSLCLVLAMARIRPVWGRSLLVVGTASARSRETSSSLTGATSYKEIHILWFTLRPPGTPGQVT